MAHDTYDAGRYPRPVLPATEEPRVFLFPPIFLSLSLPWPRVCVALYDRSQGPPPTPSLRGGGGTRVMHGRDRTLVAVRFVYFVPGTRYILVLRFC